MTEEKAKTKWCPQTAIRQFEFVEPDAMSTKATCLCIASECMWWVCEYKPNQIAGEEPISGVSNGHCGAIK